MPKPKILFFDLETSALETRERKWTLWDERPIRQKLVQDYQILTAAWCWYDPDKPVDKQKILVLGQDDFPDYKPGKLDETSLLKAFYEEITQADYIVAHNGDSFDMKKLRARMVIRGLPPFPAPKQYDTKKAAKRIGGFTSNKLADLARDLGVPLKGDPGGFETWLGCEDGDPKSWRHMKKYNKLDIPPMLGIYEKLTPWDPQAPRLNVIADVPDGCTRCLGRQFESRGMTAPTAAGTRRRRFRCLTPGCGKWNLGRITIKSDVQYVS